MEELALAVQGNVSAAESDFKLLRTEGDVVFFTRLLVSEPANVLYPEECAQRIRSELSPLGVHVEILHEEKLRAERMGALLSVGQASSKKTCMVVMKWNGKTGSKDTLAFVGKGIRSTLEVYRSSLLTACGI
nr:hypothetical protein [Anaplasma platys]